MEFPIWKQITKKQDDSSSLITGFLKETALFQGFKNRTLRTVSAFVHKRSYEEGEIVFEQGQAGAGLYIIMSGRVRIVSRKNDIELTLAEIGEKAFFGELSLFTDAPRTATAVAEEKSVLLGFFQPDLKELVERKPKIGNAIIMSLARIIAQRLADTNEVLEKAYIKGKKKHENRE